MLHSTSIHKILPLLHIFISCPYCSFCPPSFSISFNWYFSHSPANLTLNAPLELTSEILGNSTSMRVQWSHSSQGPPSDGYYVILYSGDTDSFYTSSSSTSLVIHGLTPNGYYLIILIAVSGSTYGAVIKEHRHILNPSMYVKYKCTSFLNIYSTLTQCYTPAPHLQ